MLARKLGDKGFRIAVILCWIWTFFAYFFIVKDIVFLFIAIPLMIGCTLTSIFVKTDTIIKN